MGGSRRFARATVPVKGRARPAVLLIAALVALIAAVVFVAPAAAAEVRKGNKPEVKAGERVNDDLYIFGGQVDILGTVTGDVVATAGTLTVKGGVGGSLAAAAGRAEIRGAIGHSIRVAGGDVTIAGAVGGDVVVVGGSVTVESTGSVKGDVVVTGGDVDLRGPVTGGVRGNIRSLTINNRVGGDVDVSADTVHLQSKARLAAGLRYQSHNAAKLDTGAVVGGQTRHTEPARFYPGDNLTSWLGSTIFRLLCALIAGVVTVLVMPRGAAAIADGVRHSPLATLLVGFLLLIFLPVGFVLMMVTIIGIPIALIGLAFYFCALYLSQVFLGLAMGRIILPKSWDTAGRGYNLLAMTLGVLILAGLRWIPVPFVGLVVAVVTAILGLGAIFVGLRSRPDETATALPRY